MRELVALLVVFVATLAGAMPVLVVFVATLASAMPVRPPAAQEPPKQHDGIAQMDGEWGPYTIHQSGRTLTMYSPDYYGVGYLRDDGKIVFRWWKKSDLSTMVSLYELTEDGSCLRGRYGSVQYGAGFDGNDLVGFTIADNIKRTAK